VKTRFQSLPFKFNLQRYNMVPARELQKENERKEFEVGTWHFSLTRCFAVKTPVGDSTPRMFHVTNLLQHPPGVGVTKYSDMIAQSSKCSDMIAQSNSYGVRLKTAVDDSRYGLCNRQFGPFK
jgi:hypothetical protein